MIDNVKLLNRFTAESIEYPKRCDFPFYTTFNSKTIHRYLIKFNFRFRNKDE